MKDKAGDVFTASAERVDIDSLLDYAKSVRAKGRKKLVKKEIKRRLDQEKILDFILKQPKDTIKALVASK